MNRPDKAEELFRKGYNCSQSTFAAFADVLGMTVEEAAKIDGCSNSRFIVSIVLPLSKAILAVLALYFMVANWNAWFQAYLYLNDADKYPLQLVLKEILLANSMPAGDAGAAANASGVRMDALSEVIKYASILVACVPIWCIYPFMQKYFVKGVMIGAIKG